MRVILFVLLGADCAQFAAGLVAVLRGRHSLRAGAPSYARFSFSHGALLVAGAVLLAVPVVIGIAGVVSARVGVYAAFAVELALFGVARRTVKRLEAAHLARRPQTGTG